MNYREEIMKEIETIKERTIKIKLSDADVIRVWEKAARVGLSLPELIENFIGDLVCGTYTNGSDERDLADQWFNRCGFGRPSDKSLLPYLIEWETVEDTIILWKNIVDAKKHLVYADINKEKYDKEEVEEIKENLAFWEEDLNDTFSEYQKWAKDEQHGTLEEEMEKVLNWHSELNKMKDGIN